MGRSKNAVHAPAAPNVRRGVSPWFSNPWIIVGGLVALAAVSFILLQGGTASESTGFSELLGTWGRVPDSQYTLEVRSIAPDGRAEVAYFNPKPIHVAEARAEREGNTLILRVKLQDVNYDGSNYRLTFVAPDTLRGNYEQIGGGSHSNMDVEFTRLPSQK